MDCVSSYFSIFPCYQTIYNGSQQIKSALSATSSIFTGNVDAPSLQNRRIAPHSEKLKEFLTKAPEDLNNHWDDYLKSFSELLFQDDLQTSPVTKKDFETLFERLSSKNLRQFFESLLEENINKDIRDLPDRVLEYLPLDRLDQLLKEMHPGKYTCAKDWAKTVVECLPEALSVRPEAVAQEKMADKTNVITSFFPNLGHIFMRAFDLFDTARPPESLYEYGVLVTLYINFFALPYYMCYGLSALIAGPWMVALTAFLIISSSIAALYIHLRWFKKCPDEIMFCENITKKFKNGEVEAVIGRETEYAQALASLSLDRNRKKGNVVLVGNPGVGKTEFLHGLAERLPDYKVMKFKNWALFGAGGSVLSAGEKMDLAFKEARGYKILFCYDELGDGVKNSGFVDYLRQVLPNTKVRFIAAMTYEQWEKIKSDSSEKGLEERLTPIYLDPPDGIQTFSILSDRVRRYAGEMQVMHKALKKIIELTNKHRADHAQPRNSLKSLDELMGKVQQFNAETYSIPELRSAQAALSNLKTMSLAADSPLDFPYSKDCDDYLRDLQDTRVKIDELEKVVESQKVLIRTMTKYLRYLSMYQERRVAQAYLLTGKNEADHLDKKKFLLTSFIALPALHGMIEKLSVKLNKDVYLRIDEQMVNQAIAPKN